MTTTTSQSIRMLPKNSIQKYWHIAWYKTISEIQAEVSRTYLGFAWWFIEPILFLGVYYLIFGVILGTKTTHFIEFLMIGLVTWRWFQVCTRRACDSITKQKNLIQQVYISKLIFPLVSVMGDTLKFFCVFGCILLFVIALDHHITLHWLALLPIMATQFLLILGVSFCCASITPFVPDLPLLMDSAFRGLMFMSGIFFDISALSPKTATLLQINPMAGLMIDYRNVLINQQWPSLHSIVWALTLAISLMALGTWIIRRNERIYPKVCL